MDVLIICFVLVGLYAFSFIVVRPLIQAKLMNLSYETGYIMDQIVTGIIDKAVLIAFTDVCATIKDDKLREKKFNEVCPAIIADVMLQHGIAPKDYNLAALIIVSRYNLNLQQFPYTYEGKE